MSVTLLAALFGALTQFYPVAVPNNMTTPQSATFALWGFAVHEGKHDTNTTVPLYMSETPRTRAAALIRFTAPTTGLCTAYELSTRQHDGRIHRIGPLSISFNPFPDNAIPVQSGKPVKIMVVLFSADDIRHRSLPLTTNHRTVGVECVRGKDGEIFYSRLYRIDPANGSAPVEG